MELIKKIKNRSAKIGIIGLGYVGLELAVNSSKAGFNVFGFDKNKRKILSIKKKKKTISTISSKKLKHIDIYKINNMSRISLINECDIIIICVPTPLKKNNIPNMQFITDVLNSIFEYLRERQLIILESTVYPGATEDLVLRTIKKNNKFKVGKNFYIGFSPERISPGKDYSINYSEITKVVSGYTNNCLSIINLFYKQIFSNTHKTSAIRVAEFTKLYENIYRSVNIGLVNQMKMIADSMNLNIFEIIETAKTKPFGFKPFLPGPGVGGHCIPVDPLFLSWISDKKKINSDFIKISRSVNLKVTNWVISKIKKNLPRKNSKILIIGITYKKNIDDLRESPLIKIFKSLNIPYKVDFYDTYAKKFAINKKIYFSKNNLTNIHKYDAVIIGTDHSNIDYKDVVKKAKKIFDTRGILRNIKSKKIVFC